MLHYPSLLPSPKSLSFLLGGSLKKSVLTNKILSVMTSNMQMEYFVLRHFNITLNEELSVHKIKPVRPTYTKIS